KRSGRCPELGIWYISGCRKFFLILSSSYPEWGRDGPDDPTATLKMGANAWTPVDESIETPIRGGLLAPRISLPRGFLFYERIKNDSLAVQGMPARVPAESSARLRVLLRATRGGLRLRRHQETRQPGVHRKGSP